LAVSDQVTFIYFSQTVKVRLLVFSYTGLTFEVFRIAAEKTLPLVLVYAFTVLIAL